MLSVSDHLRADLRQTANGLISVSDHMRAEVRQTDSGLIRQAKWDFLTRANAVRAHCIQGQSYRVHQLYYRHAKASKSSHKSQGMIQPHARVQVLVLKIQQCTCKDSAAAAAEGERRQQCDHDCQARRIGKPYRDAQDRLLWKDKTCPART
jgi:hypothetical protein